MAKWRNHKGMMQIETKDDLMKSESYPLGENLIVRISDRWSGHTFI